MKTFRASSMTPSPSPSAWRKVYLIGPHLGPAHGDGHEFSQLAARTVLLRTQWKLKCAKKNLNLRFPGQAIRLRYDALRLRGVALDEEPVVQVDEVHDRQDQQRRFPAYAPAGHAYQPSNTGADQIVRK